MFEADAADMNVNTIPGVAAEYEDKEHDHALRKTMLPFGEKCFKPFFCNALFFHTLHIIEYSTIRGAFLMKMQTTLEHRVHV